MARLGNIGHRFRFPQGEHSTRPVQAESGVVANETPCRSCGRVYPWRGHPSKVAWMLHRLGGRCPGCALGYRADRRPSQAELLDRFRRSWGSSRAGHGWLTRPRGGES